MATNKTWTDEEIEQLLKDYENRGDKKEHTFCKEWGKLHNRSYNSVRFKLSDIKDNGHTPKEEKEDDDPESTRVEYGDNYINIVCASPRIRSQEDAIKWFNIDMDKWKVAKCIVGTHEGYRKDRKVRWLVEDGRVKKGDVDDSGKMLIVPLFRVELRLELRIVPSIENIAVDFEKLQSNYKPLEFRYTDLNLKDNILEISITDLHMGKLAWGKESGEDYDTKIARKRFLSAINDILSRTKDSKFHKIIFPVGNDLLNSDTTGGTTTAGTPQSNDSRWQKLFFDVTHALIEAIDILSSVAPVEIFWIPGNHDTMSSFYTLNYLSAWYKESKCVSIDISPTPRKYVEFGNCLIGFSHGSGDSKRIPQLMQVEAREAWGRTLYREFHLGDLHHEIVKENGGLTIRRLSSLTATDGWHAEKGFVGAIQKAQAFVWNKERGLLNIINSPI